ncbi:MAG: hypothetical protein UU09_C0046G0014 [Microgenomates group bacterium GW2011_GWA2_40_6]|nr:MAG: hypothetical protein UU09_C0046G0014 [Microgenomates group bacterium GW2011_GWA2_40_6]
MRALIRTRPTTTTIKVVGFRALGTTEYILTDTGEECQWQIISYNIDNHIFSDIISA